MDIDGRWRARLQPSGFDEAGVGRTVLKKKAEVIALAEEQMPNESTPKAGLRPISCSKEFPYRTTQNYRHGTTQLAPTE